MATINWGEVGGAAAAGGAGGAAFGGVGAPIGAALVGGADLLSQYFSGDDDDQRTPPAEFAAGPGSDLTNRLAALQISEGLSQQQSQNAREAAFYNQANQNFDIANTAQLREAGQIQGSAEDQARQLQALESSQNLGQTLTDMGTRPMGDSYAEAQLRQGQAANMAQQLSMARSGRSLGSGQAAMTNAAFNNAALNQQTNQSAASARIQEQNAYNQHQVNALSQAGAMAGQAGNQAGTIREGNEALQAKNIGLDQTQQQVNNATTGLYNNLGVQQQNIGMQANTLGTNAYQFGAKQGQDAQTSQLNANAGNAGRAMSEAEAERARSDANRNANLNMVATGAGVVADELGNENKAATGAPKDPNSAFKNITTASNATPGAPVGTPSDERNKTNIVPLSSAIGSAVKVSKPEPSPTNPTIISRSPDAATKDRYEGMTEDAIAREKAADEARRAGKDAYTFNGETLPTYKYGRDTPMDEDTRKIATPSEDQNVASYIETINALQNAYRKSQSAPADVLNRVKGAGAGPSDTQAALMARLTGGRSGGGGSPNRPAAATHAGGIDEAFAAKDPRMGQYAPADLMKLAKGGILAKPPEPAAPPPAWGDVFNTPELDPRVQRYLLGYSNPVLSDAPAAPAAPKASAPIAPSQQFRGSEDQFKPPPARPGANQYRGSEYTLDEPMDFGRRSDVGSKTNVVPLAPPQISPKSVLPYRSDERSKTRIRELESQLEALSPGRRFTPRAPDTDALDDSEYGRQVRPGVDFRNAHGYEYEYKNPRQKGAAPGKQVGTMAQDLERTVAAPYVHDTPSGKMVDTTRLPLALAPAVGETQRRVDDLESQLEALQGSGLGSAPAYRRELYPQTRGPY